MLCRDKQRDEQDASQKNVSEYNVHRCPARYGVVPVTDEEGLSVLAVVQQVLPARRLGVYLQRREVSCRLSDNFLFCCQLPPSLLPAATDIDDSKH